MLRCGQPATWPLPATAVLDSTVWIMESAPGVAWEYGNPVGQVDGFEHEEVRMTRMVPAVARALQVLELFLDDDELTSSEIVGRLHLPRTTVHEVVHTLCEMGYLSAGHTVRGSWRLGVKVFQLGSAYSDRLDLAQEGQRAAESVVARCDETAHVAVLDELDVVYIVKRDSTHFVRMVSAVGLRVPAHCTAVGKMLLSGLAQEDLAARLRRRSQLPALTPQSITSPSSLRRALDEIRERGVAFDHMESNAEVNCVAAPVYDQTGAMVAAMSISVPAGRWSARSDEEWIGFVQDGAAELAAQLGKHVPRDAR